MPFAHLAKVFAITDAGRRALAPGPAIIAALDSTEDAVIRVGSLLIVKVDRAVTVTQLTADQQATLDHRPELATSPHKLIAALGVASPSQGDDPQNQYDPDALAARHNLASWKGDAGDAAGAAAAFEELLADRLRLLGPDHPDTLATRHSLARWLDRVGMD